MRIVSIARGFEDYVIELTNALSHHAEVHVVVSSKDEWIIRSLVPSVRVFRSGAPKVSSPANVIALLRIARYIRRVRPDIVHLQSGTSWELGLRVLFPHLPFVITMHDITKHPSWAERTLKYRFQQWTLDVSLRAADGVIVHGDHMYKAAEKHFVERGLRKTMASIPHGIISRYGAGLARTEVKAPGNVLFFGFVNKYKGVEYLIKAEPLIRKECPDVNIRIEGSTDHVMYYRELLGFNSKIHMNLRRVTDERVAELFRWADVIVLPYVEASQSGVLQLAMAFAVPPVVTRVGGLPEVVVDGWTGLVVEPRNEAALASAITRLLSDTGLREKIIQGQQSAREGIFAWTSIARQTKELYIRVLSRANALPS